MKVAANTSANPVVRRIRVRATLFLLLALVAGGAAVYLVKGQLDRAGRARAEAASKTTPVVVAALAVPIGTTLEKQHLGVTNWPSDAVPERTFRYPDQVVGRTTLQAMVKGEAVLTDRLADENAGRGLTALLAKGTRAMAVKVDQVVGVAGFVQPGDYVDVITTMAPDEETKKDLRHNAAKVAKIILQNIKVLAVGEHMTTKGSKPVKVQVVTLEVTPEASEKLALASRHGEIQLTMRSRVDQDSLKTAGVTPLDLLAPDEGTGTKVKQEEAQATDKSTEQWLAVQRRRRAQRAEKKEEKPEAPVVEVLRGDKVEERKLRPTADSK